MPELIFLSFQACFYFNNYNYDGLVIAPFRKQTYRMHHNMPRTPYDHCHRRTKLFPFLLS
mgnify:CR=1 FL=1